MNIFLVGVPSYKNISHVYFLANLYSDFFLRFFALEIVICDWDFEYDCIRFFSL